MHKIAIIGSNSFIAKRFSKFLQNRNRNIEIIGYSRNDKNPELTEWRAFDHPVRKLIFDELLNTTAIIVCIGAGIQSNLKESSKLIHELNYQLPVTLINYLATKKYKGTLITFGSYFEIGNNNKIKKYTEEDILNTSCQILNDYSLSKKNLTTYYSKNDIDLNYYHLILPTIYGNGENSQRLIPYVLDCINQNQNINLTSGIQTRQYLHVKDLIELILQLLDKKKHISSIYNVTSLDTITVKEIVNIIIDLKQSEIIPNWGAAKKRDVNMKTLMLETSKLATYLPTWKPSVNIYSGVENYENL